MPDHSHNHKSRWGDLLDKAERENKIPEWIAFAARSYRRECEQAANEAVTRMTASENFRPSIPDVWRSYHEWQASTVAAFSTYREAVDAEIEENRLYRIANLTRAKWEENHGSLSEGENRRGHTVRVRRLKTAPTKYVRLNGVRIPRSKSYVPC